MLPRLGTLLNKIFLPEDNNGKGPLAVAFTSFSSDTAQLEILKQTAEAYCLAKGSDCCLKMSICVSNDPDHRWRRCVLLEQGKPMIAILLGQRLQMPDPQNEFTNRLRYDIIQVRNW